MSSGTGRTYDSSSANFEAFEPSDTVGLPSECRYLYVGSGGDLVAINQFGDPVTFVDLPAGWHPIRTTRVNATGTTASGIVALY